MSLNASLPPHRLVLEAHNLGVTYRRGSLFGRRQPVQALDDVSFHLDQGEILAVVGPSGCGKSTLARCLALHTRPSRGRLMLEGEDPWTLSSRQRRQRRPRVQWVAQSPAAALDPRFDVTRALVEPLRCATRHGIPRLSPNATEERVEALLQQVDLSPSLCHRPCHHLSGGQKQRLVIARALAAKPRILIFDEALAAVDGAQRRHLMELLRRLRESQNLSYVWISHDLQAVAAWAHRVLVLDHGRLVEEATAESLLTSPQHPVSRALVEAL